MEIGGGCPETHLAQTEKGQRLGGDLDVPGGTSPFDPKARGQGTPHSRLTVANSSPNTLGSDPGSHPVFHAPPTPIKILLKERLGIRVPGSGRNAGVGLGWSQAVLYLMESAVCSADVPQAWRVVSW